MWAKLRSAFSSAPTTRAVPPGRTLPMPTISQPLSKSQINPGFGKPVPMSSAKSMFPQYNNFLEAGPQNFAWTRDTRVTNLSQPPAQRAVINLQPKTVPQLGINKPLPQIPQQQQLNLNKPLPPVNKPLPPINKPLPNPPLGAAVTGELQRKLEWQQQLQRNNLQARAATDAMNRARMLNKPLPEKPLPALPQPDFEKALPGVPAQAQAVQRIGLQSSQMRYQPQPPLGTIPEESALVRQPRVRPVRMQKALPGAPQQQPTATQYAAAPVIRTGRSRLVSDLNKPLPEKPLPEKPLPALPAVPPYQEPPPANLDLDVNKPLPILRAVPPYQEPPPANLDLDVNKPLPPIAGLDSQARRTQPGEFVRSVVRQRAPSVSGSSRKTQLQKRSIAGGSAKLPGDNRAVKRTRLSRRDQALLAGNGGQVAGGGQAGGGGGDGLGGLGRVYLGTELIQALGGVANNIVNEAQGDNGSSRAQQQQPVTVINNLGGAGYQQPLTSQVVYGGGSYDDFRDLNNNGIPDNEEY